MKKIIMLVAAVTFLATGCSKDSGDDGNGNGGGNNNQGAATLVFPENNSECTTGTEVSETQSKITFQWNAAQNAQSYFLYVKNLDTQSTLQYNASAATSYEVTLDKSTPYSWYVSAKKENGSAVQSETWKFYNSGPGTTGYAPYPAQAVYPAMSASVYGPAITLEWTGGDPDDDIAEYSIYLDTNTNPTTLAGTTTQQTLPDVAVTSGATYYWKVVTTDEAGNATTSPVYQFKVL